MSIKNMRLDKPLTAREIDAVRAVALGHSNKAAPDVVRCSFESFHWRLTMAQKKLKANNRAHAVVLALKQGLIKLEEL